MPVCQTCGIAYMDTEIHVCQGRRLRWPLESTTAFLRRLQCVAIPSIAIVVSITIGAVAPATDPLVAFAGGALIISIWLHYFTIPYVVWLWAWRRPLGLHGTARRKAVFLTMVVAVAILSLVVAEKFPKVVDSLSP